MQPVQQFPMGFGDNLPEQQKALIQQVMSLTQDQIDKLPPEQRQQVQQLRQTLLSVRF
jgi:cleavage stimulation factor subunit 2